MARSTKMRIRSKAGLKSKSHTSLKSGRPPLLSSSATTTTSTPNLSSRVTRTLIRSHHTLQKRLATARSAKSPDTELIAQLEAEIAANGGLEGYQLASTIGQSGERGGDTSWVLVRWLKEGAALRSGGGKEERGDDGERRLKVLEVGALSTTNALNVPGMAVRRIDLRSQGPGIEEMDFMALPLPSSQESAGEWATGYDIISLSLVVNFVPDPRSRGEMLRRTTQFFRRTAASITTTPHSSSPKESEPPSMLLPALFLVLPLPCVSNSRYLTEPRLEAIMHSLGYVLLRVKRSAKLYYSLWRFSPPDPVGVAGQQAFKKQEVKGGRERNNFCIVLD